MSFSQTLNWPYRLEDWQSALHLGEGLAVECGGRVCATALWWPWGDEFATCGMIIVDAGSQRLGLGTRLMEELLRRTAGRSVILQSTEAGLRLYERLGFKAFGHVYQHQAVLSAAPAAPSLPPVRPLSAADTGALRRLDHLACGLDRTRLLDALLAKGKFLMTERGGAPSGYATTRRWGRGIVVGPVVASEPDEARALIAAALAGHQGDFVRIDVTEPSGLSAWLESAGLPCVGGVTSMARGTRSPMSPQVALCALSSQSIG
ncbi:MAG: GNAT family N-acetyltransferase [Acetobacteraceae bacterium]